mgnify:FL=1
MGMAIFAFPIDVREKKKQLTKEEEMAPLLQGENETASEEARVRQPRDKRRESRHRRARLNGEKLEQESNSLLKIGDSFRKKHPRRELYAPYADKNALGLLISYRRRNHGMIIGALLP